MSKYTYWKYHFMPERDRCYSYNNYYYYYKKNRPKDKKYILTYKQFHDLYKAIFSECVENLCKGHSIKIPYIGRIVIYQTYSIPKYSKDGKLLGYKPCDFYYNPYTLGILPYCSRTFGYKKLFKFRLKAALNSRLTKLLRSKDLLVPNIRRSDIYKLYNHG